MTDEEEGEVGDMTCEKWWFPPPSEIAGAFANLQKNVTLVTLVCVCRLAKRVCFMEYLQGDEDDSYRVV